MSTATVVVAEPGAHLAPSGDPPPGAVNGRGAHIVGFQDPAGIVAAAPGSACSGCNGVRGSPKKFGTRACAGPHLARAFGGCKPTVTREPDVDRISRLREQDPSGRPKKKLATGDTRDGGFAADQALADLGGNTVDRE